MTWRISKFEFFADFAFVPLYIAAAATIAIMSAQPVLAWVGYFAIGYVAWTLTEYWMHRSLFHRLYRREHGLHHIRPLDWIGVSPLLTGAAFIALYLFSVSATSGAGRGGALFIGYVFGYYAYITIHLLIHHTSTWLVSGLRATHEMHHRGAEKNFGVSTNVWDHVFRTYRRPV